MNFSTLLGVAISVTVVGVAATSGDLDPVIFWNPTSLLIVLGGTFGATLISFNLGDLGRLARVVWVVFSKDSDQTRQDAEDLVNVSRTWARKNIKEVSGQIDSIGSPFMRIGLRLVIDGMMPLDGIIETLRWRIERLRSKERAEVSILNAMASFAPAFGMMGTLFGLIIMLRNTDAGDLGAITSGMAVALMTTLYGIALANLVFKPFASKLERRTEARVKRMQLIMESIALMAQTRSASVMNEMTDALTVEFTDELGHELPSAGTAEGW